MDKYKKLKYNPKFLKKAYDLVKEDFPKLFRDDNNYTKEDKKNWDIALDRIYDNFVTPEEQDFIEIWGATDGTAGLLDHIYKNKNQFESFRESTNKYVKVFRESCRKLEEKGDFRKWNWDEIPPEQFTDKEFAAQSEFDMAIKAYEDGMLSKKELAKRLSALIDILPDSDWTRDKNAKLPDELFPKNTTNPSIGEINS